MSTCLQASTLVLLASLGSPRIERTLRVLHAGAVTRMELDDKVGALNSPDLIMRLRRSGLSIPCERVVVVDRDGKTCRTGQYRLTNDDRAAVEFCLAYFDKHPTALNG